MPGVERQSLDLLLHTAEEMLNLGIPMISLFPVIESGKNNDATEAYLTKVWYRPWCAH